MPPVGGLAPHWPQMKFLVSNWDENLVFYIANCIFKHRPYGRQNFSSDRLSNESGCEKQCYYGAVCENAVDDNSTVLIIA